MVDTFLISKDAEGTFDEDSLLPVEKKARKISILDYDTPSDISIKLSLYVKEKHNKKLLCQIPCFLENFWKETRDKTHNINFFYLTAYTNTALLLKNSKLLLKLGRSEPSVCYKLTFPDFIESPAIIFEDKVEIVKFEMLKIEKEMTKFNLVLKEHNY